MHPSVGMSDASEEFEDSSIDLNEDPIERKKRRVNGDSSGDKGRARPGDLPKAGKVLRSRTVAMSDGDKQVIQMEIVDIEDKEEGTTVEDRGEDEVTDPQRKTKMKGKRGNPRNDGAKYEVSSKKGERGRPPKLKPKPEVSSLNSPKRGRRRPPKGEGKCEASILSCESIPDVTVDDKKDYESSIVVYGDQLGPQLKRKRGRPPKGEGKCEALILSCESIPDVTVDDKKDCESSIVLYEDQLGPQLKRKRGRPPKGEGKCEALILSCESIPGVTVDDKKDYKSSIVMYEDQLGPQLKRKRGRPPKGEGKCKASILSCKSIPDVTVDDKKDYESSIVVYEDQLGPQLKRKRGRPPKGEGKCEALILSCESIPDATVDDKKDYESSIVVYEDQLGPQLKRKRGRPPKGEGKCGASILSYESIPDVTVDDKKNYESSIVVYEDQLGPQLKRKRGRPPKIKRKSKDSSLSCENRPDSTMDDRKAYESSNVMPEDQQAPQPKQKRGRPPKVEGKSKVSSLICENNYEGKLMNKESSESSDGTPKDKRVSKLKQKLGRPPKIQNGSMGLLMERENARRTSHRNECENAVPVKRLGIDTTVLENGAITQEGAKPGPAREKEVGSRKQKQLLRDRIVAMLKNAGWTVEYRQRHSREYQDAVYVDRDGKTHWSVTLAYKKFKEKIDVGKADDIDISAFSLIPEETLSVLFRAREKGKKQGQMKINAGRKKENFIKEKKIHKWNKIKRCNKESSESKPKDGKKKLILEIRKQRTLLARKPKDGDSDGHALYAGNRSLLSWMIDLGTVPLGRKVRYKRGRNSKILLEGRITKDGILCDCCNILHTVRGFECHTENTFGKPYQNIYLDSGKSLSQCLLDSWKMHTEVDHIGFTYVDVEGDDPNDDICNVCGDGGDLICCDSCPSTFHHGCLRINVPSGDWHCIYCSCKFCGVDCGSTQLKDDHKFDLATCHLCGEKFHVGCAKEMTAEDKSIPFCGEACSKIFQQLQILIGFRYELEVGFSYTVLQHCDFSGDAPLDGDFSTLESNSKLAVAFSVMDECFQPIIVERSGTNMIQNVVYNCGSNIRRLNYERFFTVILEKGDEIVCAASLRAHGSLLAEMPFIGTRFKYRRQGMCSRLLSAVDKVLSSLGIKKLVIPAISQLNETWTKVFGFVPLEESTRLGMKYMNLIVFPGVDMLEKPVGHQSIDEQIDFSAMGCKEVTAEHQVMQENRASDPDILSDEKTQDLIETSSCTKSTEVQNLHDNTREQQKDQGVTPPNSEISSDSDTIINSKPAPTESTEVQTLYQDRQEEQKDNKQAVLPPNYEPSPVPEVHIHNKDVPVGSDAPSHLDSLNGEHTGAIYLGESSETGNSPRPPDAAEDSNNHSVKSNS